ncbi:hypothetical protein C1M51_02750 [Methylibium sp. Pch-M]|uniref:hypothetical protein n=1 Tax=Methylibium sp. Pch-M TaxID=2082386 RepID=UPI0010108A24|nr:hypothetical protein [Methylibium sp. Pch-M]QAZ38424.1 hypothetical protein C1M51_02750 [Methylibium sp. Pch-M]
MLLTSLKTFAALAALVAIIPLMVWAGSGSWRHALHATKEYLLSMGVIVVPVLLLVGAITLAEFIG